MLPHLSCWPLVLCLPFLQLPATCELAFLMTFLSRNLLPSAEFSNPHFHCGSPDSARMSAPKAHTLLGTWPDTFTKYLLTRHSAAQVFTYMLSFPSHKNFIAHLAKEEADRLNYPKLHSQLETKVTQLRLEFASS